MGNSHQKYANPNVADHAEDDGIATKKKTLKEKLSQLLAGGEPTHTSADDQMITHQKNSGISAYAVIDERAEDDHWLDEYDTDSDQKIEYTQGGAKKKKDVDGICDGVAGLSLSAAEFHTDVGIACPTISPVKKRRVQPDLEKGEGWKGARGGQGGTCRGGGEREGLVSPPRAKVR